MLRLLCRFQQYWRTWGAQKLDTHGWKAIAAIYKANDARLEPDMRSCCAVSWHGQSTNVVHNPREGSNISLIEANTNPTLLSNYQKQWRLWLWYTYNTISGQNKQRRKIRSIQKQPPSIHPVHDALPNTMPSTATEK